MLTQEQAIEALKEGKTLTHRFFERHEYIYQNGFTIFFEDGNSVNSSQYWWQKNAEEWQVGWDILVNF